MGGADKARSAHARYFVGREAETLNLWDGTRQAEAYSWLTVEMANLRLAFRWAADHGDLDTAATIAYYAAFVGFWGEQHEPIRWAEELIEPARSVQHRRLAQLYAMAALCHTTGTDRRRRWLCRSRPNSRRQRMFDEVRAEFEPSIGSVYIAKGQPERWLEWCRSVIARRPGTRLHVQACLVLALKFAGEGDQAIAASEDLLGAADAWDNRNLACWALFAYGTARAD